MAKFVAYKSTDTRDLSEVGLLQNIKKNLDRSGEGKSFDASTGNISLHVEGKAMLFVFKKPVSGTMKSVDVKVGGADQYSISGLSIKLKDFKSFFKGNYESKIFSGNDNMTGSGQSDTLAGFDGRDNISGAGAGDTILGGSGNDKLYGETGNDVVKGGKGNDLIDGGPGINTLTGNAGSDSFLFSSQLNASNSSRVTDFKLGEDIVQLDDAVFPGIGAAGKLSASQFVLASAYAGQSNVVVYNKANGDLSYAVAANNLIKFGELSTNLNVTNKDFLIV